MKLSKLVAYFWTPCLYSLYGYRKENVGNSS